MFSKRNIAIAISIILFFVLIIIKFFYNTDDENYNISVSYERSNSVEIKTILPLSDTLGKNYDGKKLQDGILGYVVFSVENLSNERSKYEIFITKSKYNDKEIRGRYIKFYLTDYNDIALDGFNNNKIPTYNNLYILSNKPDSKLLYTSYLEGGESKQFKLRVWLSDTYILSNEEYNFLFDVGVRGV